MEYTKGEWKAFKPGGSNGYWDIGLAKNEGIQPTIATCWSSFNAKANAHLIAAAPDMYEGIKELFRRDDVGSIRLPHTARAILSIALAKAEGK